LAELLLHLHVEGSLSAKHTCLIAHWASQAGAKGPVEDIAFRPEAPTGHYQRHLDSVTGMNKTDAHYLIPVPGHTKHSCGRTVHQIAARPPHEIMHDEIVANPDLLAKAATARWPASYSQHRVARATARPAMPIAFYMDGCQFTKVGASVLVFVVVSLVSGAQHLSCVLRKKEMCKCGCRGWCSLWPILEFFRWSFAALARGAFPAARHDGTPWPRGDPRAATAALRLACGTCAVQQVKGDWAEYCHSLGFPTWKHSDFPCLWCRADQDSLYTLDGVEDGTIPWDVNDAAAYEEACRRCEIHVAINTEGERQLVAQQLYYDKRVYGSHGRALKRGIPALRLEAGDRLEPCPGLPDVGAFAELELPATVLFWRTNQETFARHRNPIFAMETGISVQTLRVDPLHALYLGVFQVHCAAVLHALIEADVWETAQAGHANAPERMQASCLHLTHAVHKWVRSRRGSGLTEIPEITSQHLGSSAAPMCKLKGAQTKTMLLFLQDFVPQHGAKLRHGAAMAAATGYLVRHMDVMRRAPHAWSLADREDLRAELDPETSWE
jgi:hypothetical protein